MTPAQIKQIESDYNVKVLYITKSGSHLYGTNTPSSDTDYKGVFLPSKDSLLLGKAIDYIKLDTNKSNEKNSSDDIDIHLDSIHKYLSLLSKGETGAIDTYFSMFRPDIIVYSTSEFLSLKSHTSKLISAKPQAFVGYCISQTKKYNVRGERYNELVELNDFLGSMMKACNSPSNLDRILEAKSYITQFITSSCSKYIKYIQAPAPRGHAQAEWTYLEVLGKKFAPTVTLEFLQQKLADMQSSYGSRARAASDNIDWKAMSHAVRVILEIEELLTTGLIKFPLKDAPYILQVKQGKLPVDPILQLMTTKIEAIDSLMETTSLPLSVDTGFIDSYVLSLYKDT